MGVRKSTTTTTEHDGQRDGTKRSGAGCCMHFTIRHDSERAYFGHIHPHRAEKISVSFTLA
jgi:hypothetical protein